MDSMSPDIISPHVWLKIMPHMRGVLLCWYYKSPASGNWSLAKQYIRSKGYSTHRQLVLGWMLRTLIVPNKFCFQPLIRLKLVLYTLLEQLVLGWMLQTSFVFNRCSILYWVATVDKWLSQGTKIILIPHLVPTLLWCKMDQWNFLFHGRRISWACLFLYTLWMSLFWKFVFFPNLNSFSHPFGFQVLESLRTCLTLRYLMSHFCRCYGHFIFYIFKSLMQQKHVWEWACFVQVIKFFF